jgi:AcrR family transcriptional regulator
MTAPAPGRPQSEKLNRSIRAAAIEVLAEVGFDALSVAEVARRAGSTPPAIYRRFPGKTELVIAALREELSLIEFDVPDLGSLRAELLAWTRSVSQALTPERLRIMAALFLASRQDPIPAESLSAHLHSIAVPAWRTILCRARVRDEIAQLPDAYEMIGFVAPSFVVNATLMLRPHDGAVLQQLVDSILIPALRASPESNSPDSRRNDHE